MALTQDRLVAILDDAEAAVDRLNDLCTHLEEIIGQIYRTGEERPLKDWMGDLLAAIGTARLHGGQYTPRMAVERYHFVRTRKYNLRQRDRMRRYREETAPERKMHTTPQQQVHITSLPLQPGMKGTKPGSVIEKTDPDENAMTPDNIDLEQL